jgi:hypothetical protein
MKKLTFKVSFQGSQYEVSSRDSQRKKLYEAERKVFTEGSISSPWVTKIGKGTLGEAAAYVKKVAQSKTWAKLMKDVGRSSYANWVPPVKDGRGSATGGPHIGVKLPDWSRCEPIVLHELAHCIAPACCGHNWLYAHIYIKLVSRFMGTEWADKLRKQFRKDRVKFTPPRPKRELTEEQKAVLRERCARARAARGQKKASEV